MAPFDALIERGARRNRDIQIGGFGNDLLYRAADTVHLPGNDSNFDPVLAPDLRYLGRCNVLITWLGHFEPGGQIHPELKADHFAVGGLWHFLMHNPVAGSHPLNIAV